MKLVLCCLLFFFKQKTAYEMRISDWSSDVCSSDLRAGAGRLLAQRRGGQDRGAADPSEPDAQLHGSDEQGNAEAAADRDPNCIGRPRPGRGRGRGRRAGHGARRPRPRLRLLLHDQAAGDRSEEHTSELQSLMRISYAVFYLKKKINRYI